jgi:hypothetical protein
VINKNNIAYFPDNDLAFVMIPNTGADDLLNSIKYTKQSIEYKIISFKDLRQILKCSEIEVFTMMRNPYDRANDIFENIKQKYKKDKIGSYGIGSFFENILNGWKLEIDEVIYKQYDYINEIIQNTELTIFYYEEFKKQNFEEINQLFDESFFKKIGYFDDTQPKSKKEDFKLGKYDFIG